MFEKLAIITNNKVYYLLKEGYIQHCKNHHNSQNELAEWCIKDHKTDKILKSFTSEKAAKEGLQNMHIFKNSIDKKAKELDPQYKYGIFVYAYSNDECIDTDYAEKLSQASDIYLAVAASINADELYVELWKRDEEGLFGNSGKAIESTWKSKEGSINKKETNKMAYRKLSEDTEVKPKNEEEVVKKEPQEVQKAENEQKPVDEVNKKSPTESPTGEKAVTPTLQQGITRTILTSPDIVKDVAEKIVDIQEAPEQVKEVVNDESLAPKFVNKTMDRWESDEQVEAQSLAKLESLLPENGEITDEWLKLNGLKAIEVAVAYFTRKK